MKRVDI